MKARDLKLFTMIRRNGWALQVQGLAVAPGGMFAAIRITASDGSASVRWVVDARDEIELA